MAGTARKLASGLFFRLANTIAAALVSILVMPFVVHSLGDRDYGIWTLVGTFVGYYGVLELGFAPAVTRHLSHALGADLRGGRRTVLIDGGRAACNTTYVDNLVDAVFLFLENRALAEIFFITDGERVTWGDFIRAHAAIMEPPPDRREIPANDVLVHYQRQPGLLAGSVRATGEVVRSCEFRKLLERNPLCERSLAMVWRWLQSRSEEQQEQLRFRLGLRTSSVQNGTGHAAPPIPDPVTFATQTGTAFFRIDKARRPLGYEPRIPFSRAIGLVEQWLRFANYLPEEAA